MRGSRASPSISCRAWRTPPEARLLEVLYLTVARLAELAAGGDEAGDVARLHAPAALRRLERPLDADLPELRHRSPVAEAAVSEPVAEPAAVADVVERLRALALTGAARRFIALVPPERMDDAEPVFSAALAAGEDFDLELVPATDVASVRRPGWILVPTSRRPAA